MPPGKVALHTLIIFGTSLIRKEPLLRRSRRRIGDEWRVKSLRRFDEPARSRGDELRARRDED